jgi:hypothetical protein
MLITCALRKAERWVVRQATSLRSRFAEGIIVKFITLAMKPYGGKKPVLIRSSMLVRFGFKRIRWLSVRSEAIACSERTADCGSGGRWFESTQLYQTESIQTKELSWLSRAGR